MVWTQIYSSGAPPAGASHPFQLPWPLDDRTEHQNLLFRSGTKFDIAFILLQWEMQEAWHHNISVRRYPIPN